ncbi:DNA-binding protein [Mycobacterium colombiense]|uniref:DNA-binding protein n=1 Tax=Mycobacterium colombiense TaxID=339268 RepID=A0A329L0G6_9MYCO|nr:helix-turn-helix domain-containing protein [Mycobacterium colombiense]RAV00670.1 DNA-binding protein [Mycobacterium colombiense]
MRRERLRGSVDDELLTPEETAEKLRTNPMALAQMRYRGTGPKFIKRGGKRGGRVLYRRSDIDAYLDGQTCERTGA